MVWKTMCIFADLWGFSGKILRVFFLAVKKPPGSFFLWRLWHPQGYPILWGMGCFDHQILGIFGRETWILSGKSEKICKETNPQKVTRFQDLPKLGCPKKVMKCLGNGRYFTPIKPYLYVGVFQQPIGSDFLPIGSDHGPGTLPGTSLNSCRCWGA